MFKFGKYARPVDPYSKYRDAQVVTSSRATTGRSYGGNKPITREQVRANMGGMGGSSGMTGNGNDSFNAGGSGIQGGSNAGYNVDRYNPVFDQLEEGTILEDWIPRDAAGLDLLFRRIYLRDPTIGPGVDLIRALPWSDYTLEGIDDPAVRKVYEDCVEAIAPLMLLPDLTGEFLIVGKNVSSLIFDERRGIFSGVVPHDPDFLRIKPMPVYGYDPLCDFKISPRFKQFLNSDDPREMDARKALPPAFLEAARSQQGFLPLDPVSTVYLARKTAPYDSIGTSLLTRTLYFWAIEKALLNATMSSTRRRARSLTHIKAGIDNVWEPTSEEIDAIAGIVLQANEDPVGGVVATRTGVDISEPLGGGADFYKWSDELELFAKYKMQCIGISDALLSGDATYNNAEQARSVFVEQLATLRMRIVNKFFMDKMFPTIARIHGFVKRSKAELNHRIRTTTAESAYAKYMLDVDRHLPIWAKADGATAEKLTQRKTRQISQNELLLPTFNWSKQLKPNQDEKALEILEKLKQNDYPTTLSQWAMAAGYNPETISEEVNKDETLKRTIADIQSQGAGGGAAQENAPEDAQVEKSLDELMSPGGGGESAGEPAAAPEAGENQPSGEGKKAVQQSAYQRAKRMDGATARNLTEIAIWKNNQCAGLKKKDAAFIFQSLVKDYSRKVFKDPEGLMEILAGKLGKDRAQVMAYCLNRMGITKLPINHNMGIRILSSAKDAMHAGSVALSSEKGVMDLKRYEIEYKHITASVSSKNKSLSFSSKNLDLKVPELKNKTQLFGGSE